MKILFAGILALSLSLPVGAQGLKGQITTDPTPLQLVKTGHLARAHWYSIKPGRAFWVYEMSDGSKRVEYKQIIGVPDTRNMTERNILCRMFTNSAQWAIPMLITGFGVWVGATNK